MNNYPVTVIQNGTTWDLAIITNRRPDRPTRYMRGFSTEAEAQAAITSPEAQANYRLHCAQEAINEFKKANPFVGIPDELVEEFEAAEAPVLEMNRPIMSRIMSGMTPD